MNELIDRLDAEMQEAHDLGAQGRIEACADIWITIGHAYPELRALVLRLEEERDNWMVAAEVDSERLDDEKRRNAELFSERDALLEALKKLSGVTARLDTLRDGRPDLWEQVPPAFRELLNDYASDISKAVANVEGTE